MSPERVELLYESLEGKIPCHLSLISDISASRFVVLLDLENVSEIEIRPDTFYKHRTRIRFWYTLEEQPTSRNCRTYHEVEFSDYEIACLIETLKNKGREDLAIMLLLGTITA